MSAPHIPLPQRKALSGRLAFFDAYLENEIEILEGDEISSVDRFRNHLFEQFDLDAQRDNEQRESERASASPRDPLLPLDESLRNSIAIVEDSVATTLRLPHNSIILTRVLPTLEGRAAGISCAECGSSTGTTICDGVSEPQDDITVSRGGACIAQLHRMFMVASEAASAYYSRFSTLFSTIAVPPVVLSTQYESTPVNGHYSPSGTPAGAVTIYDPRLQRSQVRLHLPVQSLDLRTYVGLQYLLFHECISHAFHGLHPNPGSRTSTKPYESFAEGWMDWVSYKIFEEVVRGTGFLGNRWMDQIVGRNAFEIATTLHSRRIELIPGRNGSAQVLLGAAVASITFNFIKNLYQDEYLEPADGYRDAFFRLSFDLNLLGDISTENRDAFVRAMRRLRNPSEDKKRGQVSLLLMQYLRGILDIYELVNQLSTCA